MYLLDLVLRWAHILAAITAVGGVIFMRAALHPTVMSLDEATRKQVQHGVRARWAMYVHLAIAFLLVSGLYNFVMTVRQYNLPKYYHPLWGVKFLIALVIFFIAESLVGRSARSDRMRSRTGFWLTVNLSLAVLVVLISGVLKLAVKTPKTDAPPSPDIAAVARP